VLKIGRDGERKHSALHRAFRLRYFFDFFPLLALALMAAWAAANRAMGTRKGLQLT